MLLSALLIIAIVDGQTTTINYEKVDSIQSCQKMALDIKDDSEDGVYVACLPIEPTSEI